MLGLGARLNLPLKRWGQRKKKREIPGAWQFRFHKSFSAPLELIGETRSHGTPGDRGIPEAGTMRQPPSKTANDRQQSDEGSDFNSDSGFLLVFRKL
jgi:hypothetical protein